ALRSWTYQSSPTRSTTSHARSCQARWRLRTSMALAESTRRVAAEATKASCCLAPLRRFPRAETGRTSCETVVRAVEADRARVSVTGQDRGHSPRRSRPGGYPLRTRHPEPPRRGEDRRRG